MANDALTAVRTRRAPNPPRPRTTLAQTKAITGQVRNAAGGYVFSVGDEARLHRFLTLGTDGGTFYTSERNLTKENAEVVFRAAQQAPLKLVEAIKAVSLAGRAPRQNAGIFALAIAASHSDFEGRKAALDAVPEVCRTATSFFQFLKYAEQFRGWGRGMRRAAANWYDSKDADKLAVQILKYRQREGFTHLDALRLCHTAGRNDQHRILFNYLAGRTTQHRDGRRIRAKMPDIVLAFEALKRATTLRQVLSLIEVDGITWEMIPDQWINEPQVWGKLLLQDKVPVGAMIRQLPRLTNLGLTSGASGTLITDKLTNVHALKGGRIHPVNVLVAQKTYASGRSEKGSTTWTPDRRISNALDQAFYSSFGAVTPAGKKIITGIDVSASMTWNHYKCSGAPLLTPLEATAAVAMVTADTEPEARFVMFDTRAWQFDDISSRDRLDVNIQRINRHCGGGTDVSQVIQWAVANRVYTDAFQILTDGESWKGTMHPFQAMKIYRDRINPDARLSVVAMTATGQTVVPPFDDKAIDVAGFDAAVPQILADFSAGRI